MQFFQLNLATATAVTNLVDLLVKTRRWSIEKLHLRDHEVTAIPPIVCDAGTIGTLYLHINGEYLTDEYILLGLLTLFKSACWVEFVKDMDLRDNWEENQLARTGTRRYKKVRGGQFGGWEKSWFLAVKTVVNMMSLPKDAAKFLLKRMNEDK